MSVLVKGMEKPEHCGYCRFRYDGICHALQKTQYRMNECPLVVIDDAGLNDTISRQAAIKAICEDGTWLESQGCTDISMAERKQRDADILGELPSVQPQTCDDAISREDAKWVVFCNRDHVEDQANAIDSLPCVQPSAQSEQQWIPCSERLPEEGKEVLISSDSGLYIAELEILEGNVYWNETIEYRSVKRVSAWRPLPEPYKGGEQNG